MAQYKPYLISNFKTGKFIALEPWLSPQDAFPTLINGHVNKGVLEKRLGMSLIGQGGIKHGAVAQTNTTIMGIKTFVRKGFPEMLVMDTKRCNYYNPLDDTYTDISSDLATPADIFDGKNTDFFSFANYKKVCYMVNNHDQIHSWAGRNNAVVPFNYQFDSDDSDTNHLNTCRFIFIRDDRMQFLDTVEKGTWHPNRLRYTPVNQETPNGLAAGGGTVDAPTQGRIGAAGLLGRVLVVYFEGEDGGEVWLNKPTGITTVPYAWTRKSVVEGSRSPYSMVPMKMQTREGLAVMGLSSILFFDGFNFTDIELPNLRDIHDEMNNAQVKRITSYNQQKEHHILFTYAVSGSSNPDRILDYNMRDNNYTVHKSEQSFFVNVIGGSNLQYVPIWTEADLVHAGDDNALVSAMDGDARAVYGSPSPATFVGCRNSRVYKWGDGGFDGTDDADGNIEIDWRTARLNPFTELGRKAKLDKIEFLVDNDSTASFLASLYGDAGDIDNDTAYKAETLSLAGDTNKDKTWVTLFADGEVGDFHQLKISHTARANRPRIHAMLWWMKPAGRLYL
jgi:hypothetical protein